MSLFSILFKDPILRFASIICFLGFTGFLAWSGFAPLAEGVIAVGQISVEDNRKTVQHLEGGIIEVIHVVEGDFVHQGAPLLTLTDIAAQSGREQLAQELVTQWVSIDRLNALLTAAPNWQPSERVFAIPLQNAKHDEIVAQQQELFNQQRRAFEADMNVLRQKRSNLIRSGEAIGRQIEAALAERKLISEDAAIKRQLVQERLTQADQLKRLERDMAALDVRIAGLNTDRQDAQLQAVEVRQQIEQKRALFNAEINTELTQLQTRSAQAVEQLETAQDIVNRTTIVAPQSGKVLNLKFFTNGGVVRAGEAIMEIVPNSSAVIALLELKPGDRDVVYEGLEVRAHLSGLNSWRAPVILGSVRTVSADLKTAPNGQYQYYEAQIVLNPSDVTGSNFEIIPGMPVEAFIVSGHNRTLLQYLLEPITGTLRRSLPG